MKNTPEPIISFHQNSDSDLSTVSTASDFAKQSKQVTFMASPPQQQPKPTLTRRHYHRAVHFDEIAHVRIVQRVTKQDAANVWYTPQEMASFHAQTQNLLHQQKNSDPKWSVALLHVYRAFRGQLSSQAQLMRILDRATTLLHLNEHTVGLEASAHDDMMDDFLLRRQHLMQQVHRLQTQVADTAVRQEMIAETSRLTSRAARMFAGYTARVAAFESTNEHAE